MGYDIFDSGTPKYNTAQAIYDGLCELVQTEEMNILSEMFANVSYDNQEYYYTEKGYTLKERFEQLSDYGNKMWIMDLAVFKIDQENTEIHDIVYEALINSDMAKRLDFKKLFIEHILGGYKTHYEDITSEYLLEIQELSRFHNHTMVTCLMNVMAARGYERNLYPSYNSFCYWLGEKIRNLRIHEETQLIAECRALLTSYDDFILGLKMNQALYEAQEQEHRLRTKRLQESYEEKVRRLYLIAQSQGVEISGIEGWAPNLLPEGDGILDSIEYPFARAVTEDEKGGGYDG